MLVLCVCVRFVCLHVGNMQILICNLKWSNLAKALPFLYCFIAQVNSCAKSVAVWCGCSNWLKRGDVRHQLLYDCAFAPLNIITLWNMHFCLFSFVYFPVKLRYGHIAQDNDSSGKLCFDRALLKETGWKDL